VVDDPTRKRSPQQEERKDEQEAGDALRHKPARQRSEEIADEKIFPPGQQKEASEAAYVYERAPDSPPGTRGSPGRNAALQPKDGGKDGLAEEHKHNARGKEQKRGSPADLPEADALCNFLRGVLEMKSGNWNARRGGHNSLQS